MLIKRIFAILSVARARSRQKLHHRIATLRQKHYFIRTLVAQGFRQVHEALHQRHNIHTTSSDAATLPHDAAPILLSQLF
jgi:hypothetical protein